MDHEISALFENILSNACAEDQKRRAVPSRKPIDTLTLGVIVALQRALGQRCLNVSSAVLPFASLVTDSLLLSVPGGRFDLGQPGDVPLHIASGVGWRETRVHATAYGCKGR